MTDQPHSATLSSSFELRSLFNTTFSDYEKRTGVNLVENHLAIYLNNCDTAESIVATFRNQIQVLNKLSGDDAATIMKWLKRIVRLSYPLSANGVLGNAVASLSFPPDKAFFAGLGVLLIAIDASQVSTNYDMLIDLSDLSKPFSNVSILLQLLSTLGLATQQVNQGGWVGPSHRRFTALAQIHAERVGEMLLGENDVEAVLQRLGNTSQNESRTAAGQALEIIYGLVQNMKALMNGFAWDMGHDNRRWVPVIVQRLATDIIDKSKPGEGRTSLAISHGSVRKPRHGAQGSSPPERRRGSFKVTPSLNGKRRVPVWIHGKPGSGKSVLWYENSDSFSWPPWRTLLRFKDTARQSARDLVSSLLAQLCEQSDLCSDILSRLYSTHAAGSRQPRIDALLDCLKDMLALPGQGPIYIILDGLDESPKTSGTPSKRESILELVEWLVNLRGSNLRICVSSCAETDIRGVLQPLASQIVSLHDEMGHIEDINDYIYFFVKSDAKMGKWRNEDKDFVVNKLSEEAGGIFRWVFCQLDQLRRCLPEGIRRTYNEFPETLKEAYERILQDIDEKRWMCAHRLFQCLAVASRPLRVSELGEFLAWDFRPDELPVFEASWRPEDLEDALLSTCSSLIAIINMDGSSVVQFSHFSVRQFLLSSHLSAAARGAARYHFSLEQAHFTVGQGCLAALLQLDKHINKSSIVDFPLAVYAAQSVVIPAPSRYVKDYMQEALKRLFDPNKPHFAIWVWIYNVDENSRESMTSETPLPPRATPLYYASQFGYLGVVEWLLSNGHYNFSDISGHYGTPMIAASAKGHYDVLQKLLWYGGNSYISTQCPDGRSALYLASENGHRETAELLLGGNANVDTWFKDQDNPLGVALRNGHLEVAKLLLERGAHVDHQNRFGETLLHHASLGKYDLAFVRLLLDRGANISVRDNRDQTPLQLARTSGQEEIAQLLSEHGAGTTN
ncbi:hypothetical protein B0F90DRAFT_1825391 [Multifurca ochricompacta]|uniref:NACHT domain-containing protein n=1 Tax=Multifurca ochricompacta TaxID=376703 RepID=A0AAD4LTQ6_9AGAM|nr:hypothetical protein B0F90DRAFT_1825391 [Multifurca ochricompacta]